MMKTEELATEDHILTYAQHMAQTAKCDFAKRLFEVFAQQAAQRIEAKGGLRFSTARQEIGGDLAPASSASKGDPARSTRSEPTIKMTKAKKNPTAGKGQKVEFQVTAEPGSEVFVAGSFNDWNPTQHRMSDNPGSGQRVAGIAKRRSFSRRGGTSTSSLSMASGVSTRIVQSACRTNAAR